MSDILNNQLIRNVVADFLPNEVMFALGEYSRVECASLWIKKLQAENESLKAQLKREMDCVDFYAKHNHWRSYPGKQLYVTIDFLDVENEKHRDIGGKLARETVKARTSEKGASE